MTSNNGIIKSFGTILRNNPLVEEDSKKFKTIPTILSFTLPKDFNGKKIWKDYLKTPVRSQGQCGNCWAHSMNNQLEDRYSLQSYGKILSGNEELSAVHLTVCEYQRDLDWKELKDSIPAAERARMNGHSTSACNGNSLYNAAEFLYRYGTVMNQCVNKSEYGNWCKRSARDGGPKKPCESLDSYKSDTDLPTCESLLGEDYDLCLDRETAARRYRAAAIYNVPKDEKSIKSEIYRWGPISGGFQVFADFESWDGKGIYTHPDKNSKSSGGHAITITGWGEENGIKFWRIENSWSDKWGEDGFCKIQIKLPGLELEDNLVGLIPDIPHLLLKCIPNNIEFLQAAKDDEKRRQFGVDDATGYRYVTIQKIREGKIKGDLRPLITVDDVPDYCDFIAATVDTDEGGTLKTSGKIAIKAFILIMFIIAIFLGIKQIKKKR